MKNKLSSKQIEALLDTLKTRLENNKNRHAGIDWKKVNDKRSRQSEKLWSLFEMEKTGGEPDVIEYDKKTN